MDKANKDMNQIDLAEKKGRQKFKNDLDQLPKKYSVQFSDKEDSTADAVLTTKYPIDSSFPFEIDFNILIEIKNRKISLADEDEWFLEVKKKRKLEAVAEDYPIDDVWYYNSFPSGESKVWRFSDLDFESMTPKREKMNEVTEGVGKKVWKNVYLLPEEESWSTWNVIVS